LSRASGTRSPAHQIGGTSTSRAFLLRKLHSLSGVAPVGVFLVVHLWTNARVLGGRDSFDEGVRHIQELPALPLIEVFGILLPLAFHALYGVKLAFEARSNVASYGYTRNWLFVAQRGTGLVALAFVLYHLWELRIQKALGNLGPEAFYDVLAGQLSSTWRGVPVIALVYLVGLAASAFHFANGLWGFCASWGLVVSRPAQRTAATVFSLGGFALFALGAATTLHLATGAHLLPSSSVGDGTCVAAPASSSKAP
jgi:succinate dehydrogenase/fumarate reductase cytochrome b subunit (b558 family)